MDPAPTPVTVVVIGPPERTDALVKALDDERIDVVGTADAETAEAEMRNSAPDIVVAVADPDTLTAAGRIGARAVATRTVAVGAAEPETLVAGRVGSTVPDDADADVLVGAVLGLALGEARLDPEYASHVAAQLRDSIDREPLSNTEDEVMTRLAAGDPVDELAETYAVSPRLVRLVTGGAVARLLQD